MQRDIIAQLIIVTLNLMKTDEIYVLSESPSEIVLPRLPWNSNIGELIQNYTDLSPNWINPQLLGVEDHNDSSLFFVNYYASLPPGQEILQGHWLPLAESDNDYVKKLAMQAAQLLC